MYGGRYTDPIANTEGWPNVVVMSDQRLWHWPIIKPAFVSRSSSYIAYHAVRGHKDNHWIVTNRRGQRTAITRRWWLLIGWLHSINQSDARNLGEPLYIKGLESSMLYKSIRRICIGIYLVKSVTLTFSVKCGDFLTFRIELWSIPFIIFLNIPFNLLGWVNESYLYIWIMVVNLYLTSEPTTINTQTKTKRRIKADPRWEYAFRHEINPCPAMPGYIRG